MTFEAKLIEAAGLTQDHVAQLMALHQSAGPGADEVIASLERALAELEPPMLVDVVRAVSIFYVSAMKDILLRQLGIEQQMSAQQLDGLIALSTYLISTHTIHADQRTSEEQLH